MSGKLWKTFNDLLPKQPRQLGEVSAVLGAGRYRVTLIGGGTIQATAEGTYTAGDKVFIVGQVIESKAPSLTILPDIEI